MSLIDRGLVMFDYLQRLGRKDTYKAKYEALADAVDFMMDEYGTGFRCWVSKPTDEEREAAAWET